VAREWRSSTARRQALASAGQVEEISVFRVLVLTADGERRGEERSHDSLEGAFRYALGLEEQLAHEKARADATSIEVVDQDGSMMISIFLKPSGNRRGLPGFVRADGER
jgi:hypothetical protein